MSRTKVVFLHAAEQDLKDLRSYLLSNFGRDAWRASYGKLKQSVDFLSRFPDAGSVPEELASLGMPQYRQIMSGMNRIIYEVRRGTVYIYIVCDARMEMTALLARRLLRAG